MTILKRLRDKHRKEKETMEGVIDHSASYFEMEYKKFDDVLHLCFMAPNLEKAKIKAKYVLNMHNGDKVISVRKLDASNLGKSLTWNRNGRAYSRYQSKRENLTVYKKGKK